jgi:hypothetical protein
MTRSGTSRREFLTVLPVSAAGSWAGAAGLLSVFHRRRGYTAPNRPFFMVTLGDSSIVYVLRFSERLKFGDIVASQIGRATGL